MPITVRLEDGTVAEFPDGSTPEFIQAQIQGMHEPARPEPGGLRGAVNYMAGHPATGADLGHAIGAGVDAIGSGVKGMVGGVADAYMADPTPDPIALAGRVALNAGRGLANASMGEFEKAAAQQHLDEVNGGTDRGPTGRGLSATGHAIAGAIPGVGPLAAGIVERGAAGDVSGAIGELGGNVALARGLRAAGEALPSFPERLSAARERGAADTHAAAVRRANQILGVKPKDFERGMDPSGGAIRTSVDLTKPRPEIHDQMRRRLDQLTAQELPFKADPRTANIALEMKRGMASAREVLLDAEKVGLSALAKSAGKVHMTLERMLNGVPGKPVKTGVLDASGNPTYRVMGGEPPTIKPDMTPADLDSFVKDIDKLIETTQSSSKLAPVTETLYSLRKSLSDKLLEDAPAWRGIKTDKRDLARAKEAISGQILKDKAAYPPKAASVGDNVQTGLDALSHVPYAGAPLRLPAAALRFMRHMQRTGGKP